MSNATTTTTVRPLDPTRCAFPGVPFKDLPKCTRRGCDCRREGCPHEFDFEYSEGQPVHRRFVSAQTAPTHAHQSAEIALWTVSLAAVGDEPWRVGVRLRNGNREALGVDPLGMVRLAEVGRLGEAIVKAGKLRDKLNASV